MDGKWLKQLLVEKNKTQRALAAYLGLEPEKINRIIHGKRKLSAQEYIKAQHFFGDKTMQFKVEEIIDVVHIPLYDVRVAAGVGAPMGEAMVEKHISVGRTYIEQYTQTQISKLAFIKVEGDSMSPTVNDKEIVLFDFSVNKYVGPGIYLIILADVAHIKRIGYDLAQKSFLVTSDNPAYPPMHGNDIIIQARAVMVSREL